jgi:hypothetical protein
MTFSKIDYNSSDEIFEVKIIDSSGLIDTWKFQKQDFPKWVNIISKKYGISMRIKQDSDLDWAL